jgi:hypothetical protein
MVEATEVRYRLDPALPQNWPCQWRIFVQRQVRAGSIVIVGVGAKHAAQMCLSLLLIPSSAETLVFRGDLP